MLWQDRRRKHRVIATPSRNISIMHYNLTSSGSNASYQDSTNNGNTNVSYTSNLGHDLSANSLQYGDPAVNDNIGMWKQAQLYQSYPMNSYLSNYPKQQQLYYAPQTYAYRPISQMQWFNRVPTNYQYYYSMTYPKSQNNNIWSSTSSIQQPYSTSSTPTSPLQVQQPLLTPTYTYPVYPYNAAMYNALAGTSSLTTTKKSKKKRKRKNRKKGKENKVPKSENLLTGTDDFLPLHISMATLPSTDEETVNHDSSMSETPSVDEETDIISQEGQDISIFKLDQSLQNGNSDIFKKNMENIKDKQDQELQDIFIEFQLENHINDQIFQDCQQDYDEDQVFNQSCQQDDDKDQEIILNNFGYETDSLQNIELDSNFSDKETVSLIESTFDSQLREATNKLHLNPLFANEDFDDVASDCGSEDIDFVMQRHTPVELNYQVSPSESLAAEIELATEKAKRRQGIVFDDDYDCIPLNDEDGLCEEIEELMGDKKRKGGTRIILALSKKNNVMSYRELQANEDHLIEQIEQEMDMKQSDSGVQSEESGDENDDVKISKSTKIKSMTEEEEDEIWNIEKCNLKLDSMKRTEKSPLLKNLDGPIMPGCGLCCVVM